MLILRAAMVGWLHLDSAGNASFSPHLAALIALEILSVALIVGLFTPLVACLSLAVKALDLWGEVAFGPLPAIALAQGATLVLLGPGAYSVDAILYGRRVTVFASSRDQRDGHL